MDLATKRVLITGGASGIGLAFTEELIRLGCKDLAIVGRREQPIQQLITNHPGVQFLPILADLNRSESTKSIIDQIEHHWGKLDLLINNAGVVAASELESQPDEDIINQITINLTGLILLTKKALPLLKRSDEAAIINVSSGLGYIARPFYSVYAATKAAVRQFSDALRRELFHYPIHIMTAYPTATDTPMMKTIARSNMDDPNMVARQTLAALQRKEINVIFGGAKRFEEIQLNFSDPVAMDEKLKQGFEENKSLTKGHRAM